MSRRSRIPLLEKLGPQALLALLAIVVIGYSVVTGARVGKIEFLGLSIEFSQPTPTQSPIPTPYPTAKQGPIPTPTQSPIPTPYPTATQVSIAPEPTTTPLATPIPSPMAPTATTQPIVSRASPTATKVKPTRVLPTATLAPLTQRLPLLTDESGWVTAWGQFGTGSGHPPQAGDLNNDAPIRGFLSFDLTSIPSNATVRSARLILPAPQVSGHPFPSFGSLKFEAVWYGLSLGPSAYSAPGYLELQNSYTEPDAPFSVTAAVREALSRKLERYQVRFSFALDSNNNHSADEYVLFQSDSGPLLEVVYATS